MCCAVDDWLTVAWQGMQAKGISAILYFVVWIVVGNFILLTLFLAILISTFQDEPTPTPVRDDTRTHTHAHTQEQTMVTSCTIMRLY